MIYNYIFTHFYVTCLVLYACICMIQGKSRDTNFFGIFYHVFTLLNNMNIEKYKMSNENFQYQG